MKYSIKIEFEQVKNTYQPAMKLHWTELTQFILHRSVKSERSIELFWWILKRPSLQHFIFLLGDITRWLGFNCYYMSAMIFVYCQITCLTHNKYAWFYVPHFTPLNNINYLSPISLIYGNFSKIKNRRSRSFICSHYCFSYRT